MSEVPLYRTSHVFAGSHHWTNAGLQMPLSKEYGTHTAVNSRFNPKLSTLPDASALLLLASATPDDSGGYTLNPQPYIERVLY